MRKHKSFKPRYQNLGQSPQAASPYGAASSQDLSRPIVGSLRPGFKQIMILLVCILISNALSHTFLNPGWSFSTSTAATSMPMPEVEELYLIDKASAFVEDTYSFERKVREISSMLGVAPEWLMAVMYSESKFDASVKNFQGSGATGLIQFMPASASELDVSLARLARMDHLQQMEYVYLYLQNVQDRYGNYNSLTDLYLGILYPKALNQDYCYTLYAKPSQAYQQNRGLDENKDGRVTVSDIDRRMQRLYPTAYISQK